MWLNSRFFHDGSLGISSLQNRRDARRCAHLGCYALDCWARFSAAFLHMCSTATRIGTKALSDSPRTPSHEFPRVGNNFVHQCAACTTSHV